MITGVFYGKVLFVEVPDVEAEGDVGVEVMTEVSFENFYGFLLGLFLETVALPDFRNQTWNLFGTHHRDTRLEHEADWHIDPVSGISCLAPEHFALPMEELDFQNAPVIFHDVDIGAESVL